MTVIVSKMPGGIAQLFNPDTGKITYKCKSEQAFLKLDAFDGIVQFNKKNAKAIVDGPKTALEDCQIIKENDSGYSDALKSVLESAKKFKEEQISTLNQEITQLEKNL